MELEGWELCGDVSIHDFQVAFLHWGEELNG